LASATGALVLKIKDRDDASALAIQSAALSLQGVDHLMQVSRGTLDIKVFVLPSSAFRAENRASMDLFEVAVGEFIPSLGIFPFFIVDPEVPIAVLEKTVFLDELILSCCRWLMLTPRVSIVDDNFSVGHKLFGVIESTLVQLYCHDSHQFLGIAFILNQYAHDLQCAHRRFNNLMPGGLSRILWLEKLNP